MLAHFLLVLFIVAGVCDLLGYSARRQFFSRMAWWLLSFAVFMTILTVLSGYLAESLFHWPEMVHHRIGQMERYGWIALGAGAIAWVLRAVSLYHTKGSLTLHITSTIFVWITIAFVGLATREGELTVLHPWLHSVVRIWPPAITAMIPTPLAVLLVLILVGILGFVFLHHRRSTEHPH